MKEKYIIELDFDAEKMHGYDPESIKWFYLQVILGDGLLLHSNELGDTIGTVKVLKILND